jgi:hypothetical protein
LTRVRRMIGKRSGTVDSDNEKLREKS